MNKKKSLISRFGFLIFLAHIVGLGFIVWGFFKGAPHNFEVTVRKGFTTDSVTTTIERATNSNFAQRTALLLKILGPKDIESVHGFYRFRSGTTPLDVARTIARHAQSPMRVTFNNVRTMEQLAEIFGNKLECSSNEFLNGFNADTLTAAQIFPDTYEFYWTATPNDVAKVLRRYNKKWWNSDNRIEAATRLGLTPSEVAIIGSIVEEETIKKDERGKVARLYINRLKKGMPLQADPTVKYAVGDFTLRRITAKHLAIESPYNTYLHPGLPPTPIRIPEKSTLQAVLDAPEHNYIYMCAREDFSGYHNFTASWEEHRRNASRYRAALNARGIK